MTYTTLLNDALQLYREEHLDEAYNLITENMDNFKAIESQLYNFRYAILAKQGKTSEALELFREAVMDKMLWYDYDYLMHDDDLKLLYNHPKFITLADICKERSEKYKHVTIGKLHIQNKKDTQQPLLMALHGNEENYQVIKDVWAQESTKDILITYPESSVAAFANAYIWNNPTDRCKEIKVHFDYIKNQHNITDDIIISGFSAGAGVALESIINGAIPANKLVLLSPWLPNLEHIKEKLYLLKDTKVFLACGDKDTNCFNMMNQLASYLDDLNIPYKKEIFKDKVHEYPEDMNGFLERVLKY